MTKHPNHLFFMKYRRALSEKCNWKNLWQPNYCDNWWVESVEITGHTINGLIIVRQIGRLSVMTIHNTSSAVFTQSIKLAERRQTNGNKGVSSKFKAVKTLNLKETEPGK